MFKRGFYFTLLSLFLPAALAQSPTLCTNLFGDAAPVDDRGSTYIPLDSWIYPAMDRLYAFGHVDTAYLGMRPWTRLSIVHMLDAASIEMESVAEDEDDCRIYQSLQRELEPDVGSMSPWKKSYAELDSLYTRFDGIGGTPLRDSFHLGQSIVNDYGRPYQRGFSSVDGASSRMGYRRLSFYLRGEYQHAPSAPGYSSNLAALLSENDGISFADNPRQDTIPAGPLASVNQLRIIEANVSYLVLNHEISFGKNDHWLGPARGGVLPGATMLRIFIASKSIASNL